LALIFSLNNVGAGESVETVRLGFAGGAVFFRSFADTEKPKLAIDAPKTQE
jgi:hypothetical protein